MRREGELTHEGIHHAFIILGADELTTGDVAEQQAAAAGAAAEQATGAQPHTIEKALVQRRVKVAQRQLAIGNLGATVIPRVGVIAGGGVRAGPLEPQLVAGGHVAHVGAGQFLAGFDRRGIAQAVKAARHVIGRRARLLHRLARGQNVVAQFIPPPLPRSSGSQQCLIGTPYRFIAHGSVIPMWCCSSG